MPKIQNPDPSHERPFKHLILRRHAERYILITLLTFALTVAVTRLFLNITGYPKLGSGSLHISHVLWGGVFLFASVILLLAFINQRVFTLSAALSGVGVGLFIDEVGKFITSEYDYFVPTAAPIIYSFFLLTALVYSLVVHRKRSDSRLQLYGLLGDLEEILDLDYTDAEVKQLLSRLDTVQQDPAMTDLKPIAQGLHAYLTLNTSKKNKSKPGFIDLLFERWITFRNRYITKRRLKSFLIGGLLGLTIWELYYPLEFIIHIGSTEEIIEKLAYLVANELVTGPVTIGLFVFRLGFDTILGIALLIAVLLFFLNKDRKASAFAYISLLVMLTSANLVIFYFDQFSMILNAGVQFILFLAVIYYRKKYLEIAL
ncbi:MAG: hypothetical protein JXR32_06590 [Anaerolineaceae bacterium]|nr:hypothetical protein [Anaerolineaceae bacterium]